jgi:hypothetical protein
MASFNDPFSLMFKNMGFETIVKICHVTRYHFITLFSRNGITIIFILYKFFYRSYRYIVLIVEMVHDQRNTVFILPLKTILHILLFFIRAASLRRIRDLRS